MYMNCKEFLNNYDQFDSDTPNYNIDEVLLLIY